MEIKTLRKMINGANQHFIDTNGCIPSECTNPIVDKKWVAVDDILKNIQDMKALWQEDVLDEKWFNDLINTLSNENKIGDD